MYGISFEPTSSLSQYQQLVNQLRERIASGILAGGTKLISSRELSKALNIARGIVTEAYDQLKMEGYLEGVHGSGTYVKKELLWRVFKPAPTLGNSHLASGDESEKGERKSENLLSFIPGMPDMNLFPRRKWLACYHEALEYAEKRDLEYAPALGRWDLRKALAGHLRETKGIDCDPGHIIITSGSSQAFAILCQIKKAPRIVLEDPQAEFVYRIFHELAGSLTLVSVDREGLLEKQIPDVEQDWIYVTPNHQFPVGGFLSAERRIHLLRKAQETGAYIIEDDFDSEFRYVGKPVPPLKTMAPERVVYIGTFSKIVSPALRIAFMVLPESLTPQVTNLKKRWDFWNEGLQQKAMAQFINKGYLSRHIAKAHRNYQQKNQYLKKQIAEKLSSLWSVSGDTTGMHLVLNKMSKDGTPEDVSSILEELKQRGFLLDKVSSYCRSASWKKNYSHSLLISFGKPGVEEIDSLMSALCEISD